MSLWVCLLVFPGGLAIGVVVIIVVTVWLER